MHWLALLLLVGAAGSAAGEVRVDRASVTVERRAGRDWCVLDSAASCLVALPLDDVAAVIQDYGAYPRLFPKIRQAGYESLAGGGLLSEVVAVEFLGIQNINRFTLRVKIESSPGTFKESWTQERTDGTIDSLEGYWLLEDAGSPGAPLTRITYHTRSAVPVVLFGENMVLGMVLGKETKAVIAAVIEETSRRNR
jgi:hypothetical protein